MSERCLSSAYVEKLGHKIQEIRERALKNLISKLEAGYVFDNDLARSKEILEKLLDWFSYPEYSCENLVFKLIHIILKTEAGKTLIKHYGSGKLANELKQLRNCIEPDYFALVDETIKFIQTESESQSVPVPPLVSDIPLSYRSGEHYLPNTKLSTIGTTATPIVGVVEGSFSNEQQTGIECDIEKLSTLNSENENYLFEAPLCLPYYTLCWYTLINTDQHVLESVENSLKNPPEPSALLHTCEFFTNVMLHDFPAEVFLQRPSILLEIQKLLLTCTSSRIKAATLTSLVKLTKLLNIRINYYSDPCMYHLRQFFSTFACSSLTSPITSSTSSNEASFRSNLFSEIEKVETVGILKRNQLPLPYYCLNTISYVLDYLNSRPSNTKEAIYMKKWRVCTVRALYLLNDLIALLELCLHKTIWDDRRNVIVGDVIKSLKETLIKFGDTIDYIRLVTISNDFETNSRFIHISLLNSCLKLLSFAIPADIIDITLPRNLKNAITNTLLDPSISRLYPGIHNNILELVKKFSSRYENDTFTRYQDVEAVCKSMSSAINLLRNHTLLPMHESILLVKSSLKSLEFHKKPSLIRIFVELCSSKLPALIQDENLRRNVADIVVELLNHCDIGIRKEMYHLCAKRVICSVGPKLNTSKAGAPGSQILFLLHPSVSNEIALYGLSATDSEIQNLAEDIVIHILKCKILVTDEIWNSVIETLIVTFPALLCYADQTSPLGRTVMGFLDPDTAQTMNLTTLEIFKGNCCLLFNESPGIREEAISRLCWLLASQGDKRDLLPRINNLFDKTLSGCCQIKHVYDLNRVQCTQHYYQSSSLQQVLQLLSANNVEPVIRRSALTQISVMMEDSLMHNIFLQNRGVNVILDVMKSALDDSDYKDYPDSVIPAASVLKNVCLCNATVRQELSVNLDLYYLLLRGLFLFSTEERMRHEGSTLLFLLLYNNFIKGSPTKSNVSMPHAIINKLKVPFTCQSFKTENSNRDKLSEILLQDKYCLRSLRIHWNSEWFGGFNELLPLKEINYKSTDDFNNLLKLSNADLIEIQNSSLEYCMHACLMAVQNATNHQDVTDSLVKLTGYIHLYRSMSHAFVFEKSIYDLPWRPTFSRMLNTVPTSREDYDLLQQLLEFLTTFVLLYKAEGADCWISELLKCETNALLTLLSDDFLEDSESKTANKDLLLLITTCVSSEQHYLDFYGLNVNNSSGWSHVIELIASSLKFIDSQHFYNLAYLDNLLSCLVHLTASLGWTKHKNDQHTRGLLIQLITSVCKMIGAFHSGKGASAANSVMGLSITRHAVLILNHLLVEMQQSNINEWESCFIDEESGIEDNFYNLTSLWYSRDVVLRAGIFQLFAGLATSHKCAINIVQECKHIRKCDIWEMTLDILLDHEEASIVRENVAGFLTNLASHTISTAQEGYTLDKAIVPSAHDVPTVNRLLRLFSDHNFYSNLELVVNCLYIKNKFYIDEDIITKLLPEKNLHVSENYIYTFMQGKGSVSSNMSDKDTPIFVITTPALVKSLSLLLLNILNLAPVEFTAELQHHGLIRVLFKSLHIANIEILDTKDLALYCDILEMNRAICALLSRAVNYNDACFNTVLNTRDCLNILLSLLNTNIYNSNISQLIYLRNKLWTEIFTLLANLLNHDSPRNENFRIKNAEVLQIISSALSENSNESFIQTLCEAVSSYNSADLQNSALTSLTSLLKMELESSASSNIKSGSVQCLLDTTSTPRTILSRSDEKDNIENLSPNTVKQGSSLKDSSTSQRSLRQLYMQSLNRNSKNERILKNNMPQEPYLTIAGAEICRILLHMFEVVNIKGVTHNTMKKKNLVLGSLTNLLCVSEEAKKYALANGLADMIVKHLREFHVKLSLETVESLRRVSDKKRIIPVLQEINILVGLFTNFMAGSVDVKDVASVLGLADLVHKLWVWILPQKNLLVDVLQMLCTYTTDCLAGCQSLTLTSPVAGTGPRKLPSNVSLLHAVITLIAKEMEQISRTRDLSVLELSCHLLQNSCTSTECRIILSKTNLLQSLNRLHPAITRKQKPWEAVELLWLEFLQTFSTHPEGQFCIAKTPDVLDLIIILTNSSKLTNRHVALMILRNISFFASNRPRLLTSGDFLNVLNNKLISGNVEEKTIVTTIIWALAANNQKAKLMLKCAGLEAKLQESLRALHLSTDCDVDAKVLDQMHYVLKILKDGVK